MRIIGSILKKEIKEEDERLCV